MKSLKLFAITAAALACGIGSAHAGNELVLEEVIVRAKVPAGPIVEHFVIMAELPAHLKTEQPAADEPVELVLTVERPHVDTSAFATIEPTLTTLRL